MFFLFFLLIFTSLSRKTSELLFLMFESQKIIVCKWDSNVQKQVVKSEHHLKEKGNLLGANSERVIRLFYGIFSGNAGSAVGETVWERPGFKFYHKAGSDGQYYWTKTWLLSMLLTMLGTMIENINEISKIQGSINNLKVYQKYQNSFVIFDAESNFDHIYSVVTLLSFFSFVKKETILIYRVGDQCVDNHQFFCVPRSPYQNFDCVNEIIYFWHLMFLISNFWCGCYHSSRARLAFHSTQ